MALVEVLTLSVGVAWPLHFLVITVVSGALRVVVETFGIDVAQHGERTTTATQVVVVVGLVVVVELVLLPQQEGRRVPHCCVATTIFTAFPGAAPHPKSRLCGVTMPGDQGIMDAFFFALTGPHFPQ